MRYSVSSLMDEIWERAVETALDGEKDHSSARTLTLDGAVKCIQGRLPPPSLLEKFQNLQHLSIASIGVSSLEQFPKLLKLERLILSDNRITGGLEFLVEAGLDSLRDLDLSNNRIQHIEDLAPLAQLKLVSLDLYECPVTRVKDYRSRVFKLIESLKYLDKMDLQEKERPESEEEDEDDNEDEDEEEDEDDNEDEDEEEDEDPGSGEIDGEDRQFVECNGHGEGVGGVVNVDEEEEREAEEEDGDGSNRVPNGRVQVEHMEEDGDGENDSGEEIDDDDDDEDFNIEDIRDHFVEVHQVVESGDDEDEGIDDDDDDDDDDESDEDDDDDEMGIGNVAQVEVAFDEPLPDTRGLFIDMSGEIDGHEHGEEDGDGDNNGETGEEEIGIEYDPEFEDDDDEEEDLGAGYLVQPVSHSEALNAGINGGNNDEEEKEIDDNDSDDAQVLPPSSSNLKRKRDDDGDEQ